MPLDFLRVRQRLDDFEFGPLFVEELGWSRAVSGPAIRMTVNGQQYDAMTIAQLGGVPVLEIRSADTAIPDAKTKRDIQKQIAKLHHENLLIFTDRDRVRSVWFWTKRENGRDITRPHEFVRGQPADLFFERIRPLLFDFEDFEKGDPAVVEVVRRLKEGFDVEKITKRFYSEYDQLRIAFVELISGIADERQRRWYASVLLNRLMFIWFLQRKGFLDNGDYDYLEHKLEESEQRSKDGFFASFLKLLFFEGFAKPAEERSQAARELLGEIRYLNGGLFLPHPIEQQNPKIDVPDRAFKNLFKLFRGYSWNLNDTPFGDPNEINPDVLGYIFEKYINQKAFGAYYTRTEITTYLCERTIHRRVLDAVNTSEEEKKLGLPGKNYEFKSIGDLKNGLDATLCRKLLFEVLPRLSILDPACGSGAFLVAALKTLLDIYGSVIGQAKVRFAGDSKLAAHVAEIERGHPNVGYYIKKRIITDNLYGVDIMEEAVEIAKLRLFLTLVASARSADQLEPLPNIDFSLLAGNSLIGLMRVDAASFDQHALFHQRGKNILAAKSYRAVLDDKNRAIDRYRHAHAIFGDDLRLLRDDIDRQREEALPVLDDILLDEFRSLGIQFEDVTWENGSEGKTKKRPLTRKDLLRTGRFHWGYEFDRIMNVRGGFDVIITNPPWDKLKPNSKEFFQEHSDIVSKNNMTIHQFEDERDRLLDNEEIRTAWLEYLSDFPHQSAYFRKSPDYVNQVSVVNGKKQGSDLNLYKLFTERCFKLLNEHGSCGLIAQGGLHTDLGAKGLRELLFAESDVDSLFVLANERFIFDNVDHRQKFCVVTFHRGRTTTELNAAFRINPREAVSADTLKHFLTDEEEHVRIPIALVGRLSPDSLSVMEFRSDVDMSIVERLYTWPLLGELLSDTWNIRFANEFHMTQDGRRLFRNSPGRNRLPVYEGKMLWQFDAYYAQPRFWIDETEGRRALLGGGEHAVHLEYESYRLAFRDVASSTNERAMISTILPPRVFAGHTVNLYTGDGLPPHARPIKSTEMLVLAALFNSFICDWILKLKVAQHVSFFYVYQVPVPRLQASDRFFDDLLVRSACLTCTTPEFDVLAREAGLTGWETSAREPGERGLLQAEIDAIVACLYGLSEDDLRHIMTAFPLVEEHYKNETLRAYGRIALAAKSDETIVSLIAQGESATLEFKSSARFDYRTKQVNKELELVIVKTVAAFMNSEGGTLLIGVADDGNIVGLDADFQTVGKKNADAYENWLTTRLLESIGRDRARLIRITFHSIEEKQICRVDVGRSRRAVFVRDIQSIERIYVRAGNSTRELSVSEAVQYCREHFEDGSMTDEEPTPQASPAAPPRQSDLITPGSIAKSDTPNMITHGLFRKKTEEELRPPIEHLTIEDVLPTIRDVICGAGSVDREEAIRDIAQRLGAEGVSSRLRELIASALNAASRRSIVYSDHAGLRPLCKGIDDYSRDDLKNVLRSVIGRTWTDEADAIRAGAHYLGFRRTGSQIERAFRSAINGGLRQGVIERDGRYIRSTS
jgi:hypothetical protein